MTFRYLRRKNLLHPLESHSGEGQWRGPRVILEIKFTGVPLPENLRIKIYDSIDRNDTSYSCLYYKSFLQSGLLY